MIKRFFIGFVFLIFACENPEDCFKESGATVQREVNVEAFSKIKIYRGIKAYILQGNTHKVVIEAGENFINQVEVSQLGNQLQFKTPNSCNWVRNQGGIKVYITTPNLEEIYSKTDQDIASIGNLNFQSLHILSLDEDADNEAGAGTGDFYLNMTLNHLFIENNNVSRFFLTGEVNEQAGFNFYFGDGRIIAPQLFCKNIIIYHRGSNDMILHPVDKIEGKITSTGNVILKNNPPIVGVEQLFTGRLILN